MKKTLLLLVLNFSVMVCFSQRTNNTYDTSSDTYWFEKSQDDVSSNYDFYQEYLNYYNYFFDTYNSNNPWRGKGYDSFNDFRTSFRSKTGIYRYIDWRVFKAVDFSIYYTDSIYQLAIDTATVLSNQASQTSIDSAMVLSNLAQQTAIDSAAVLSNNAFDSAVDTAAILSNLARETAIDSAKWLSSQALESAIDSSSAMYSTLETQLTVYADSAVEEIKIDGIMSDDDENIGIGTETPAYKLDVNGTVRATEILVETNGNTADFVFADDYQLKDLKDVEKYVKENKHLEGIPSAEEMEKQGVNLVEMNKLLLQKVEELTLYVIELQKEMNKLKSKE